MFIQTSHLLVGRLGPQAMRGAESPVEVVALALLPEGERIKDLAGKLSWSPALDPSGQGSLCSVRAAGRPQQAGCLGVPRSASKL